MSAMHLTRRSFLIGSSVAAAGASAALGACSSSKPSTNAGGATGTTVGATTTTTTKLRRAGQRPDPSQPEGTDLLPQIEHIIVLMMENHSFDNYFGVLGRGDGLTLKDGKPTESNQDAAGQPVPMFHMANTCQPDGKPSQQWNDMITQWDDGAMDGFVRSASGPTAMGYWDGADIPFYYGLAKTFPICDRWFASCFGQTYPNRRYLIAGTSMGTIHTAPEPDAVTLVPTNGTIMDSLNRNGISWMDYYTNAAEHWVSTCRSWPTTWPRRPRPSSSSWTRRRASCPPSRCSNPTSTSSPRRTRRTSRWVSPSPPRW